jgi:hypothetical protein
MLTAENFIIRLEMGGGMNRSELPEKRKGMRATEPEYKLRSYHDLLVDCRASLHRAKELIRQMYNRLTLVDGHSHKDAKDRILKDLKNVPGFSERNIVRHLPKDNPNVPRRIKTTWRKNSPANIKPEAVVSITELPVLSASEPYDSDQMYYHCEQSWRIKDGDSPEMRVIKEGLLFLNQLVWLQGKALRSYQKTVTIQADLIASKDKVVEYMKELISVHEKIHANDDPNHQATK